ncbi:MAG: hypothetical protein COA78_09020 [Blastopirellula sp.]|nr:MAG: hypothetical protein COA78_09020 [Blastopirellula sp.]
MHTQARHIMQSLLVIVYRIVKFRLDLQSIWDDMDLSSIIFKRLDKEVSSSRLFLKQHALCGTHA